MSLAWDASEPDSAIAGYRVYRGLASRKYNYVVAVGKATTKTMTNLVSGVTYFFAVTAYDTNGLESGFSSEISCTVPTSSGPLLAGASGLTFPADTGTIGSPFVASNGVVFQRVSTGLESGGRAVYGFNLTRAGSYVVAAMASGANEGQNSFYVNMDAEPTDPLMIWDIPVCTTLTRHFVSWRGNGNGNPASSQYVPKVFDLSAGTHQLVIRGREGNTRLSSLSIVPAPPKLQIETAPGDSVVLSGTGQPGQRYHVLRSHDLKSWRAIGTVNLDNQGSFEFWDFTAELPPVSLYRLKRTTVTPPALQLRTTAGGGVVLEATGESGQVYNVLCSPDLKAWTVIGSVMLDANGWGQFIDPAGSSRPSRMYRLQGQ